MTEIIFDSVAWYLASVAYVQLVIGIAGLKGSSAARSRPQPAPPLDVIVPLHNEAATISHLLRALERQTIAKSLRILLVDNNSVDATPLIIREYLERDPAPLKVRMLTCEREGKGYAIDEGLKYVKSEFVAILDADVRLERSSLNLLAMSLVSGSAVAATGWIRALGGSRSAWSHRWLIGMQALEYDATVLWRAGLQRFDALSIVDGRLGLFRVSALKAAGSFGSYREAIDYVISVKVMQAAPACGLQQKIVFIPQAVAHTAVPNRFSSFARQRSRWFRGLLVSYTTQLCLWRKEPPRLSIRLELLFRIWTIPLPFAELLFWCLLPARSGAMLFSYQTVPLFFYAMTALLFGSLTIARSAKLLGENVSPFFIVSVFLFGSLKAIAIVYGLMRGGFRSHLHWTPEREGQST